MGRRWLTPAAALAVAAALGGTPAAAAPAVVIDAYVDGTTTPRQLTAGELGSPDVTDTTYFVRGHAGDPPTPAGSTSGWSIAGVLADLDERAAQAVDVAGFGNAYTLDGQAELASPSGFADGKPAIVWSPDATVQSLRPLRDDPDDVNASTQLTSAAGRPLDLYVHTGGSIPVTISPGAPDEHGTIRFSAQASGCAVTWRYGNAPPTADTEHTFADGSYSVIAAAECGNGVGGAAATVVSVGGGSGGPGPGPSPTATASPPAATATPARTPRPRASATPAGRGGGAKRGGSPHGASAGGDAPRGTAAPVATSTPAATAAPAAAPTPSPAATPTPVRHRRPARVSRSRLPVVRGRLISDVVPVSAATLAASAAPAASSAPRGEPARASGVAIPAGVLAGLALLLAGAWRERRAL